MCLVEIKNSSKAILSCVAESSVLLNKFSQVYTKSPLTKKGRESILEFLLLNHPLDCPICDQAGECDLQEHSLKQGDHKKRFFSYKKDVVDKNIGPVVKTVMSRCIHCTRCVRFSNEISGTNNLGMFGRGFYSEIGTYYDKNFFFSELSGNVIDICPVGALTSKKYPFIQRPWELIEKKYVSWVDSSGIELNVFFRNQSIVKVLNNDNFNKTATNSWITDKLRFGFDGYNNFNKFNEELIQKISNPFEKLFFFDTSNFLSKIVNNVTKLLYFNNHLNKHKKDNKKFFFLFDSNMSINNLSFLKVLTQKFKFLKIKNLKATNPEKDLESNFIVNNSFLLANIYLLINVNLRYDSFFLNVKLKKKMIQRNLSIYIFNSFVNLTYKTYYYGLNFFSIKNFCEGNNFLCQNFVNCIFQTILIGSDTSKRNDFEEFYKTLLNVFCFNNNFKLNRHIINFLNTTLNDTGTTYSNFFDNVKLKDIDDSLGFCFFNLNDLNNYELVKTSNLKLMLFKLLEKKPKNKILFLHQNLLSEKKNLKKLKKNFFYTNTLIFLNDNVYFNESELFMNFKGELKKNCKVDYLNYKINGYWDLIAELVINLHKFIRKISSLMSLNYENYKRPTFEHVLYLHFLAASNLKELMSKYQTKKLLFKKELKNLAKKLKFFVTNYILSTEDIYVKTEDTFSNLSGNMFNMSFYNKKLNTNIILSI